jgi:curved DNA-binding protein CbpA
MPSFFDVHGDPAMDPYTILSLPHTASEAEIKKAYRMQMLQLHPDKLSPTLSENSIAEVTDKFHNVKDAYEFLMSPVHLTGRRLYMAKMASRRAEYERREAFLRRNGGMGANYSQYTSGVSGYASGGGGAAGMAGSGMPTRQSQNGNSYPMPSKKMPRSKSEPEFADDSYVKERKDKHRHTNSNGGVGQPRNHKNTPGEKQQQPTPTRGRAGMHNSHHTAAKQRKDKAGKERGYKSDSGHAKTKSKREGRSSKPRTNSSSKNTPPKESKDKKRRGKSEPRRRDKQYESEGEKKQQQQQHGKERKSRDRDRAERDFQKAQKRRRAKSAPARYSSKFRDKTQYSNIKYSSSGNLPKEFFCPLTKRLMKDPVMDTEGNTYEREAIERWLRVQSSSPITNGHLSLEMLRPDRDLKKAIYKATGKPRSKSQTRSKSRSESPTNELVSGRVLVDSYLREISSKSKLSVSLDGMGICAFSYRRITFVIEVPITPHAGFMVYSSFDGEANKYKLSEKMDAWNKWLGSIGRHSRVSYVKAGAKTVFTLKGAEGDMSKCDVFQKTLEYFVEMSLKLHNVLHPREAKVVENVCLTKNPVAVA